MSDYGQNARYAQEDDRPGVDAGRLWAGGVATAVVAALVAVVGLLIIRGVFDVAVLAPKEDGLWGDANTSTYAICSALAALLATGLMHLLSVTTPAPAQFFGWIMVLLTAIAVVIPITLTVDPSAKYGTAALNLVIGLVITAIVNSMAASARTVHRRKRRDSAARRPAVQEPPPGRDTYINDLNNPQDTYGQDGYGRGEAPTRKLNNPPNTYYDN